MDSQVDTASDAVFSGWQEKPKVSNDPFAEKQNKLVRTTTIRQDNKSLTATGQSGFKVSSKTSATTDQSLKSSNSHQKTAPNNAKNKSQDVTELPAKETGDLDSNTEENTCSNSESEEDFDGDGVSGSESDDDDETLVREVDLHLQSCPESTNENLEDSEESESDHDFETESDADDTEESDTEAASENESECVAEAEFERSLVTERVAETQPEQTTVSTKAHKSNENGSDDDSKQVKTAKITPDELESLGKPHVMDRKKRDKVKKNTEKKETKSAEPATGKKPAKKDSSKKKAATVTSDKKKRTEATSAARPAQKNKTADKKSSENEKTALIRVFESVGLTNAAQRSATMSLFARMMGHSGGAVHVKSALLEPMFATLWQLMENEEKKLETSENVARIDQADYKAVLSQPTIRDISRSLVNNLRGEWYNEYTKNPVEFEKRFADDLKQNAQQNSEAVLMPTHMIDPARKVPMYSLSTNEKQHASSAMSIFPEDNVHDNVYQGEYDGVSQAMDSLQAFAHAVLILCENRAQSPPVRQGSAALEGGNAIMAFLTRTLDHTVINPETAWTVACKMRTWLEICWATPWMLAQTKDCKGKPLTENLHPSTVTSFFSVKNVQIRAMMRCNPLVDFYYVLLQAATTYKNQWTYTPNLIAREAQSQPLTSSPAPNKSAKSHKRVIDGTSAPRKRAKTTPTKSRSLAKDSAQPKLPKLDKMSSAEKALKKLSLKKRKPAS